MRRLRVREEKRKIKNLHYQEDSGVFQLEISQNCVENEGFLV